MYMENNASAFEMIKLYLLIYKSLLFLGHPLGHQNKAKVNNIIGTWMHTMYKEEDIITKCYGKIQFMS